MESSALIQKLYCQDEQAYATLIESYSRLLWVVASKFLSKAAGFAAEDIEECVSDVFVEFWKNPHSYDADKGSLKTFLCALTKNRAISMYRKNNKTSIMYLDDYKNPDDLVSEPAWDVLETLDNHELYACIATLPEPTKEVLVRRYFYEQKPAAIAEAMKLPKKEVDNRLYRAKQTLSTQLANPKEAQA